MFPWVYGFEWNAGYLVFVSLFLCVAVVVASTVSLALWRTLRTFTGGEAGKVRWEAQFHDLTPADRACRHAMTGELPQRTCHQHFDCGHCRQHAAMPAQAVAVEPVAEEIFGMPVPLNRYYHRGHTWVEEQPDGTLLIGMDELGRRLIGPPEKVELPAKGARLETNTPAVVLERNGIPVQVLAPVDGEVVDATTAGGQDWRLRVRPAEGTNLSHLLRGGEVKAWYLRELERLQFALSPNGAAPALADGGVLVEDMAAVCPPRQWDAACGVVFLDV